MEELKKKTGPKLSIVIATYNRYPELWELLESIKKQTAGVTIEPIVVDQSEDFKAQSERLRVAGVAYHHTNIKGLSRARNIGINNASGEYICLVDDDAVLDLNYIIEVIEFFDENPDYSVLCGIILNTDDGSPFSRHMRLSPSEVSAYSIEKCMSSAITFRKEAISMAGGFDENFGVGAKFGGSEETDFLVRIIWSGHRIRYLPSAIVYHPRFDHNAVTIDALKQKAYGYGLGRGALCRKHLPAKPVWASFLFIQSLAFAAAGIGLSILRLDGKGIHRFFSSLSGRLRGFLLYDQNPVKIKRV